MADYLATNERAGTGAIMTVNIDFKGVDPDVGSGAVPYISASDVLAQIVTPASEAAPESAVSVGLTNIGPTTFRTNSVVPVGKTLRIYRASQDEYGLVNFQALQNVTENDLDLLSRQILYVSMETRDIATRAGNSAAYSDQLARKALGTANEAVVIAGSAVITSNSALAASAAAVAKSNEAVEVAESAVTAVQDALEAAEDATDAANAATTAANAATAAAAQAVEDAQEAVDEATARFLDPSTSDPALRDNGDPLQVGDRYLNPITGVEYVYQAGGWVPNNLDGAALANNTDPTKGAALVGTRIPSVSLIAQAVGRAVADKLYDTVSIKDFMILGDPVISSPETADWYPTVQRAFNWATTEVVGKIRGVNIHFPDGQYTMSQKAVCNLAAAGTQNTGAVGIRLTGNGTAQTSFVASPTNTTGCIHLTSGRNMEVFGVRGMSFLSDLDADSATNNGIALTIDSALKRGQPGYGDQPRWSVELDDIYIGGYGKTAGNIARRGNWLKGINIKDKYHPKLRNIRCLARYSNVVGARTACEYAIHFEGGCYSPDMEKVYIHGGWNKGIWLDDVFNIVGGFEDFRLTNSFIAGCNYGFGCTHEFDNRTDTSSLYEPGGYIGGLHINCSKVGITIRHHRQVIIDGVYGYVTRAERADGELLPSIILLDGAADIQIRGQFFEPGFYNSDSNATVAVRIEGASEGITIDAQFGMGGIGVLNNSTFTARKDIVVNAKLLTSRRLTTYPALKLLVDNAGTMTAFSNLLQNSQDRHTFSSGKPSTTYPAAFRLAGVAPGQMIGGGYEIAGPNSAGVEVNQSIISSRFTDNTAGSENSDMRLYVLGGGTIREALRLSPPSVNNDTYGTLLCNIDGALVFKRVSVGAANSGGPGYRMLRVPN